MDHLTDITRGVGAVAVIGLWDYKWPVRSEGAS